jgi:hypothetical protein
VVASVAAAVVLAGGGAAYWASAASNGGSSVSAGAPRGDGSGRTGGPGSPGGAQPDPGSGRSTAPGRAQPTAPGTRPLPDLTSYRTAGRTLTLRFWGGLCDAYSLSAEETSSQVRLRVDTQAKSPGRMCPMVAKMMERQVTLDTPLGDRTVVNTATGEQVPTQR